MRRSRYAVRDSWRWDADEGKLVESTGRARVHESAYVQPDLPEYVSPASGKVISGRAARREDFKRTNCRPWEGREVEQREADKVRQERERKLDQVVERVAWKSWYEAPERVRKAFRGR